MGDTKLTIRPGDREERVRLCEVGKVKFVEITSRARVRETGHVVIGGLVGVVHGFAKDARCP